MPRLLFICGRNRLRSPTAEAIFDAIAGIECESAGLSPDANTPLTAELIEWAEIIFVMEPGQRAKVARRFQRQVAGRKLVCLNIADEYAYMDAKLVRLLWERVPRSVPGLTRP